MQLQTLSIDEVLRVHEALCRDFADGDDPIAPAGVRSPDLLASAVSRQHTGIGRALKYPDPVDNAATLLFGICNDHPFHNGNKRTALVSMLVHLDKNKLTLFGTRQKDLYALLIGVASHTLGVRHDRRRRRPTPRRNADIEIQAISKWINDRAGAVTRGEELVTYRQLKKILNRYGYDLRNPRNNSIDIVRGETVRLGIVSRRSETRWKRVGNIGYPGENKLVGTSPIKKIRRICRLTEEDGVDSDSFYRDADSVDAFVNEYRTLLRRLART